MISVDALTGSEGIFVKDFSKAGQLAATDGAAPRSDRSRAPVFVLGCPRSGTTLLYHMLLSAGGFRIYRTESSVFNVLRPCFGDLAHAENRRRLMDAWTQSKLFERSGLDMQDIRTKVMSDCRSAGDFLRIVMEEISRRQNVARWADCTPEHLLYIPEIKKAFPSALVIHIIRDGRDVALSLEKQRWIRPLLPGSESPLLAAGFFWEWIVRHGRAYGRDIAPDYLEIRFEELVQSPRETLRTVSTFIEHDLDYDRIQERAIGSVKNPNTSFEASPRGADFAPVERWKAIFPGDNLAKFEELVGGTLRDLGYALSCEAGSRPNSLAALRSIHRLRFDSSLWLKKHTPLARLFMKPDLSWL